MSQHTCSLVDPIDFHCFTLFVCVDMTFFKAESTLHFQKYPDMCGQGERLSYSVVVSQGITRCYYSTALLFTSK